MAQSTNLNVSPYFDDFSADKDYYKVLFKPGYPVQARELTGLQSILQNQIAKFGQHMFKEGSKVIPGNTNYDGEYFAIQINKTHLGIPVEYYIEQLLDSKIVGLTSGVTAIVNKVLKSENSEKGNLTLYVQYQSSNIIDNLGGEFEDGELLAADIDIVSDVDSNTYIPSGESFASAISDNASAIGAAFSVSEGVYFVRGTFVNVSTETLIISQYTNDPTGRIGLRVIEETINSDEDPLLTDNSKGFNNYSAPGADRLKITCSLQFKESDDYNDDNFVELASVKEGALISQKVTTDYSFLADELARRTYSESGDYTVSPFRISVRDSLDNGIANNGVYQPGQTTEQGTVVSDDLALYEISPGKAFVKGYEVDRISTKFVDVQKPRTTKTLKSQAIEYNTGAALQLNNVQGAAQIGVGNTYIISLRNQRQGAASAANIVSAPGEEIGLARVYDSALESGSYSTTNAVLNEWDISLYDIQPYTKITLNANATLNTPTFIKGKYSGATGFLRSSTTGTNVVVYEKTGEFVKNEPFYFNGIEDSRVAVAVTSYGMADVKSLYGGPGIGTVGFARTFTADIIQKPEYIFGNANLESATGSGAVSISTVTSGDPLFPGKLKVGNLLRYGGLGNNDFSYGRITEVNTNDVVITGITTVSGVAEGALYKGTAGTTLEIPDLTLITSPFAKSLDSSLYTPFPEENISNVDLLDASLKIRKSYSVVINAATNAISAAVEAGDNQTFLPFDEERYALLRADGTTETLTTDKFTYAAGNTQLTINNVGTDLSANQEATLITTLTKLKPTAKIKRLKRVNSVVVDKSTVSASGTGTTTLNDGLTYGSYAYGTRVQDEKICLNTPDVIRILGIYESVDTGNPSPPKMTLVSITGTTGTTRDLIIGETITGSDSGTLAVYSEEISGSQISFIARNESAFQEGETVTFNESKIQAVITALDEPSDSIGSNYTFNTGQKGTFYNYGFITRNNDAKEPKKSIKIYFASGYYEASDEGDITTKNSYDSFDYSYDISDIDNIRNTDIIDIRPRVSEYSVDAANARSPLEFLGRSFNGSGNSAANILASDEAITTNYGYYLGRIDRIYLTQGGEVTVQQGSPSDIPEPPVGIDDALELGTATLPPYLFDPSNAVLSFLKHKGYRMQDIRNLEKRIQNLEYYTSLSLLETATENLFIPDANGLNKFKSGFFVDNFVNFQTQEDGVRIKNSIDRVGKEARPTHYTNSIDLQVGPVEGDNNIFNGADPEGTNIQKTGNIITLKYEELNWLEQPFATRKESVTPFLSSFWRGDIDLRPASDTWVDTVRLDAKVIEAEGNYAETVAAAEKRFGGFDPQTGLTNTIWNGWETTWTGTRTDVSTRTRNVSTTRNWNGGRRTWTPGNMIAVMERRFTSTTNSTLRDTFRDNFRTGFDQRSGSRQLITEDFDRQSMGDRTISEELQPFMRSRNISIQGKGFKPQTRLYSFFDDVDVNKYITPKLLEIEMVSGTFQVGETITGEMEKQFRSVIGSPYIKFRVAVSNHKEGPYNNPTRIYQVNPYDAESANPTLTLETYAGNPGTTQLQGTTGGAIVPASYSSTSTTLNVDLESLDNQPQGDFYGWIKTGMILKGGTSGAEAKIVNKRVISDYASSALASFFIPNPNIGNNPKWATGTKTFTFIDSDINELEDADTIGQDNYEAKGTLKTVQEQIISIRNAKVENVNTIERRDAEEFLGRDTNTETLSTQTTTTSREVEISRTARRRRGRVHNRVNRRNRRRARGRRGRGGDPLAQSFFVTDSTGVFVTSCDIYFSDVDPNNIPVIFEIRSMQTGMPTTTVLPFSQIYKDADEITTSTDGSVATRFIFKSPVYLQGDTDYAIVLRSSSVKYKVWISRVGENDTITDEFVSQQPSLGSLFKSQNGSTWNPSQWEDLKFILNRADFEPSGSVEVYSPILGEGNAQIPQLQPNSISLQSRKIRVGLSSILSSANIGLNNGTTISQTGSNATGNLVGYAGSCAIAAMGVVNAGFGYTDGTFTGIGLTNITGSGSGMEATVVVSSNVVASATVTTSGTGYQVGDVLGFTTSIGMHGRVSVVSLGSTNQLILDNVQGDFAVGVANTILYTNTITGITSEMNWGANNSGQPGIGVASGGIAAVTDGLHFVVNHKNHGMHHETNRVTLSKINSDIIPTKLSLPYNTSSTAAISIDDSSNFSSFENVSVASSNPGYAKIGDEIISYTGTSGNSLTGITRNIDSSESRDYIKGEYATKYELGGVSLRRFNTTHILSDVSTSNPLTLDSYNIKLNMGQAGIGRSSAESFPILYMNDTKSSGGFNIHATQNMPFETIYPNVHNLTVPGTGISAKIKTISGTSINDGSGDGTDSPFEEQEVENVTLNANNTLTSPRIIASRVNETNNAGITVLPGDRSFNMNINLTSQDSFLSPVIDMERISAILTSNRVDNMVSNYITDSRVDLISEDPNSCQYISKENVLETSATSIKIIVDASVPETADIRAFYAISEDVGFDPVFNPFPGYSNLDGHGQVIDPAENDGKSDTLIPKNLEFIEYTFTLENIPSFKSFRIKLDMTSTNQAFVPRIKNLRVLTLA
tara:strand:+ start:21657 stop:29366 length:7710 start_codon:yes stop_codon:yes gene_type:complete